MNRSNLNFALVMFHCSGSMLLFIDISVQSPSTVIRRYISAIFGFGGERGIIRCAHDPLEGASKPKIKHAGGVFSFLFYLQSLQKTSFLRAFDKTKTVLRTAIFGFGGERGIRTPGPAIAGQRFSRPPH